MASYFDTIPRKKGGVTSSFYRSKKICALVPKANRKSEDDDSTASEDELWQVSTRSRTIQTQGDHDDFSSPAPSLPSSIENLNLSSDEEIISMQDAVTASPLALFPQPSPKNVFSSKQADSLSPLSIPPSPLASLANFAQGRKLRTQRPHQGTVRTPESFASVIPQYTVPSRGSARAPRLVISRRRHIRRAPLNFHWTKKSFEHRAEICDKSFTETENVKTPYEYFTEFLSDDILEYITDQTNLYSIQETNKSLNVTKQDIKDFIAINLLMGIIDMPAYTDYWSREFRYSPIADVMPLKKFQSLRRYIHFNDKLLDDGDRYYKIRPLIEKIRANFLKVPHETRFSIDEMMVPYKGKKAGNRKQYVKNKPKKWGYKIFVRAGVSGFVYDFLVYGGEDTFRYNPLTPDESSFGLGGKVVISLCKSIPDKACSIVYFDNFFTSLDLIHYLREEMGIFSLGTIRSNRLRGAEKKLTSDKELKKKPRGSHSQVVCNNNKLCIVKWMDNKCVTTASSYVDVNPMSTIMRYHKDARTKSAVSCPAIIKHYNAHMGGVDLSDMLIALYRTELKGHRWYLPLVSQILDMCVSNSWILYRRHSSIGKTMSLKMFRYSIIQSLMKHANTVDNLVSTGPTPSKKIKAPVAARPSVDVRFDQVSHFPIFGTKGRCKLCIKGQTSVTCSKCELRLCFVPDRNCFVSFHTEKL